MCLKELKVLMIHSLFMLLFLIVTPQVCNAGCIPKVYLQDVDTISKTPQETKYRYCFPLIGKNGCESYYYTSTTVLLEKLHSLYQTASSCGIIQIDSIKSFVTDPESDGKIYQCDSVFLGVQQILKGSFGSSQYTIIDTLYAYYALNNQVWSSGIPLDDIETHKGMEGIRYLLFDNTITALTVPQIPSPCRNNQGWYIDSTNHVRSEGFTIDSPDGSELHAGFMSVPLEQAIEYMQGSESAAVPFTRAQQGRKLPSTGTQHTYDIRGRKLPKQNTGAHIVLKTLRETVKKSLFVK